jgi:SAM-dependent methyltransferase
VPTDPSQGWEHIAHQFIAARSDIGAAFVRSWAGDRLPPGGSVVDVGCGSGIPIAQALVDQGFKVAGIDASPTLLQAFRSRFPGADAACEPAQHSAFFHRRFDAAVAVGLIFLLAPEDQHAVLRRMAAALKPGGRLLFTAPRQACEWRDSLTGRSSRSLGHAAYEAILAGCGLQDAGCHLDEGENHYHEALKPAA